MSVYDPTTFFDAVNTYTQNANDEDNNRQIRLATISAISGGLCSLIFDGESSVTSKGYNYLGQAPAIGDRVVVMPVGSTYVVLGSLNVPPPGIAPGSGPLFTGTAGGNTSIPSGAWTSVALSGETIDTHGAHSTSASNSRFTCPSGWGGLYLCSGLALISGGSGGTVRAGCLALNGNQLAYTQWNGQGAGDGSVHVMPVIISMSPNDYVELQVYQNAGAVRNTLAAQTQFTVAYLRAS